MPQVFPTFSRLRLWGWRQFGAIDIEFHPRLTVLTGANGAGKSTLLNILSRHLGVERPYHGVPKRGSDGMMSFRSGVFEISKRLKNFLGDFVRPSEDWVGELNYSTGNGTRLQVPNNNAQSYSLNLQNLINIPGIHIASHRQLSGYQPVPHILFTGISPEQAYSALTNESNARHIGTQTSHSLMFHIKNMVASWSIIGEGNSSVPSDSRQLNAYRGFVEILRRILPSSLGFLNIEIRPPEVVLVTKSGEFMIDSASGGLTTLIEIAALIYVCSLRPDIDGKPFVVTFDEPENHLHPSLQRALLPALVDTFSNAQFVIATHSPFMVSSVKDSNVYVLKYGAADDEDSMFEKPDNVRIESVRLDYANRAGTASEILREVLGVPTTLPEWVEKDLSRIVNKYHQSDITEASLAALKVDLKNEGLSDLFSEALTVLGRGK